MVNPANDTMSLVRTSGYKDPVWIATNPYDKFERFDKLSRDIAHTDVLVVGGGISGISLAYECLQRNLKVTLIEARDTLSGETGRTSGHLASALDDHFYELISTFGEEKARMAWDSHNWALHRVGEIAKAEGIECEYRLLPGQIIVSVPESDKSYDKQNDLPTERDALKKLNIPHKYIEHTKVGAAYEGALLQYEDQATFHPTKYLNGLLKVMREKYPTNFQAFTNTRMRSHKDHGSHVTVETEGGYTISAGSIAMTTNVPLHEATIILKEAFYRTYCVAVAAPKGTYPDVLLYDNSDPYIYVRKTAHPDPSKEYLVVGGEDHKVAQETPEGYDRHFKQLVDWTKAHFPEAAPTADYAWSGQIIEPNDYLAFIGKDPSMMEKNVYVATGDSGNGLTHGVIAGKLIADLIQGVQNPWAELYSPSRKPKPRTMPDEVQENVNQNLQYKRYIATDVSDIEEIPRCSGAVVHSGWKDWKAPVAVYKDGEGEVRTFSAICPHLKGVVAWNHAEKSWDCPIHGSRFDGLTGKCVMGPSNRGLKSKDEAAADAQAETSG